MGRRGGKHDAAGRGKQYGAADGTPHLFSAGALPLQARAQAWPPPCAQRDAQATQSQPAPPATRGAAMCSSPRSPGTASEASTARGVPFSRYTISRRFCCCGAGFSGQQGHSSLPFDAGSCTRARAAGTGSGRPDAAACSGLLRRRWLRQRRRRQAAPHGPVSWSAKHPPAPGPVPAGATPPTAQRGCWACGSRDQPPGGPAAGLPIGAFIQEHRLMHSQPKFFNRAQQLRAEGAARATPQQRAARGQRHAARPQRAHTPFAGS